MQPQAQLATSLLAAVGLHPPQSFGEVQISPVEQTLANTLLQRPISDESTQEVLKSLKTDLDCSDLIAKAVAYLEGEELDPAQKAAMEAAKKAGINLNLKPPDASQDQMRAAAEQAAKLAGLSSVNESQPRHKSQSVVRKEKESSSKSLGVTSIKRHSTQPIAMLSFTQDEYAATILEKKPTPIAGVEVNRYQPVEKDPKSVYMMWGSGREALSDQSLRDFFADYIKDIRRARRSKRDGKDEHVSTGKRRSSNDLLDGGERAKPQPKRQIKAP